MIGSTRTENALPETDENTVVSCLGRRQTGTSAGLARMAAMTPDERAAVQEKARLARAANAAARAASPLRNDFLDDAFWVDLAHRYGVRLPAWGIPITSGRIQRYLRKLNRTVDWYRLWQGHDSLGEFARLNPRWPMRALAGLLLEECETEDARAAQ